MTVSNQPLPGSGPKPATIMIVGEAPFGEDMVQREVFVSSGGRELTNMLHEVGILRTECYLTNAIKVQPPANDVRHFFLDKKCTKPKPEALAFFKELEAEVAEVNPTVILTLGNTALFALTGLTSVSKWRGSLIKSLPEYGSRKVIPTYHPAAIMKVWEWRPISTRDMARALHASKTTDWPLNEKQYYIRPSFATAAGILNQLLAKAAEGPIKLSVDIETRAYQIACVGIAWNKREAICIPYMAVKGLKGSYWAFEEEFALRGLIRQLLKHPNVQVIGQNFAYDAQYFALHDGFIPNLYYDTMVMQHTLFSSMKKSLDFLASMYCEHYVYWKDDGKTWDASIDEEQYWIYNCDDCTNTFEACEVEERLLESEHLTEQYDFLRQLWKQVVLMMLRGVRIDEKLKAQISMELLEYIGQVQGEINTLVGYQINLASPKQVASLFYEELGLPIVKNKQTYRPTTNDDALVVFPKKEPLVQGLCERIQAIRSAGVLLSTFATMPLDVDKRMRCYYNISGTVTYRFASEKNAFGSGGNLQNIPKGDDEDALEKKQKLAAAGHRQIMVPNMRKMFVPDYGNTFFDIDLDRADLMVVIWEADDDELRQAVREGIDLHRLNASALFNKPMDRIEYKERQLAKMFAHGTNYGGSARTMAINCGLTVHQSDMMQRNWFAAHPGIKTWHRRTEAQLQSRREVRNAFGFRNRFFGRVEALLPEALAWVPQSTVSIVINKGLLAIGEQLPDVKILLQVHDSIAGQYPTHMENQILRQMKPLLEIPVPYEKPLTIGVGVSTSTKSWGDVAGRAWP